MEDPALLQNYILLIFLWFKSFNFVLIISKTWNSKEDHKNLKTCAVSCLWVENIEGRKSPKVWDLKRPMWDESMGFGKELNITRPFVVDSHVLALTYKSN